MNWELPDVQTGFRKCRGIRDQIANICWIIKKQENFRKKHLLLLHWRRKWQPTPVVLPGKSHGRRSLVGYNPGGRRELDMTERLYLLYFTFCFIDHARAINCVNHNKMENSQEMGIPDHLTCLLPNLYASQEAPVSTGHGTTDLFQIGKGERQGCILSVCLFNFYAECIMWNIGLDEAQAGIKIVGRNINNLRYADDTTFMAESKNQKKTKEPIDEDETREWKSWLKTQHSKTKIMPSGPITSWEIDGQAMETVTYFIFLGSRITGDGNCNQEIKRHLLLAYSEEKLWQT